MSDGQKLYGVEYDPRRDLSLPYWQREFDYRGDSTNRKTGNEAFEYYDQTPTDKDAAKGRQYDGAAIIAAAVAKAAIVTPGKIRVTSLPPVLNSVTVAFNKSGGTGGSNHPTANQGFAITTSGSGSLSPKSSAQASASILPTVTWDIDNWFADALVDCSFYDFTISSPYTVADVLAKIGGGVQNLPVFKKKSHQLKLFGSQVSLQQSADTSAGLSFNSDSSQSITVQYESGDSFSDERGVSSHVETIPETVHDTITISSASDSQNASVTVKASTIVMGSGGSPASIPAITNEPTTITGTASASVTPTTLAATSPSNIPRAGLYLVDISDSPDFFGLSNIRATVVDFSQYV